jgi:hypothetical protein
MCRKKSCDFNMKGSVYIVKIKNKNFSRDIKPDILQKIGICNNVKTKIIEINYP